LPVAVTTRDQLPTSDDLRTPLLNQEIYLQQFHPKVALDNSTAFISATTRMPN